MNVSHGTTKKRLRKQPPSIPVDFQPLPHAPRVLLYILLSVLQYVQNSARTEAALPCFCFVGWRRRKRATGRRAGRPRPCKAQSSQQRAVEVAMSRACPEPYNPCEPRELIGPRERPCMSLANPIHPHGPHEPNAPVNPMNLFNTMVPVSPTNHLNHVSPNEPAVGALRAPWAL